MTATPTPLADLSDQDVMLNLYITVLMALSVTGQDASEVELSITRLTDTEETPEQLTTLAALMTEVDRRLGIVVATEEQIKEGRLQ